MRRKGRLHGLTAWVTLAVFFFLTGCETVSRDCCGCLEKSHCVVKDTGACDSDKNPCQLPEEEEDSWPDDSDDDGNAVDGILGLASLFCYMFHEPTLTARYQCAKENNCLDDCKPDHGYIEWK